MKLVPVNYIDQVLLQQYSVLMETEDNDETAYSNDKKVKL